MKVNYFLLIAVVFSAAALQACPTCGGKNKVGTVRSYEAPVMQEDVVVDIID